jgi:hypothetical protein
VMISHTISGTSTIRPSVRLLGIFTSAPPGGR